MRFDTGFYTDELNVYYECLYDESEPLRAPNIDSRPMINKSAFFHLIYILNGSLCVFHDNKFIRAETESVVIIDPTKRFDIVAKSDKCEYILIKFHTSLIQGFDKTDDVFKIFYDPNYKHRIYTKQDHALNIVSPLFNSLKQLILQHYSSIHVRSRVISIISELSIVYDRIYGNSEKIIDNISVRILDYIERHYTDDLTIKKLQEKFYVSSASINRICHRLTNRSFKEFVNYLRLREAKSLIVNGKPPIKVYKLCGYNDYSAFYRAYKKEHGVSPSSNSKVNEKD